jgi:type I restriction enzyme S subunit
MGDWEVKPLGQVCTIKPPKAEARAVLAEDDEVSFAPMEDLGIGVKFLQPRRTRPLGEVSGSYTYFADGDVLLAKITPCFENGKLGIARGLANGVGFGSSEYIVLRPTPMLDAEFLYYYLARPTFLEEGARTMTGVVGHKRVTKEFVESYTIPLPSLPEQRRIVAILDQAFEGIATAKANAEKNLRNAQELFTAVLGRMFPVDGESIILADLALAISDGDHSPPPKAASGVPFITISNVNKESRQIDFANTFTVPRPYFEGLKPQRRPQSGDVLYTVTGSFGIPVLVEDGREFCFQRHIGLVRPRSGVDSRWLMYGLLSPGAFAQADAGATGTAQRTVSLGVLRGLKLPRVPLDAQRRNADRLDALSAEVASFKDVVRSKLAALDELKKSFLYQAFTGAL